MARWDTIQVDGQPMRVYLDVPAGGGAVPGVVVIMHGPGLDRFIENQVEDLARHGYAAVAPDLYHRQPADGDMMARIGRLRDREILADVDAAMAHLKRVPDTRVGDLAVLGFCMGGRITYLLAGARPAAWRAAGVFYGGSASEAHALIGKDAYIAGGGNSAGQAALHLARYARRVTLVVRAGSLEAGMSHYLVREVKATPNVEVLAGTEVVDGGGDGRLQELVVRETATGDEKTVAADALFTLIGARPHTDWMPDQIATDREGFVYTGEDIPDDHSWPLERRPFPLETSMPGVLAAGDVRHASVKRVASAVGEGSIAVQLVHNLLGDRPSPDRTKVEQRSAAPHP